MENKYYLGVALPAYMFGRWETFGPVVTENFNSYTCENEMKPEAILVKPEAGGEPAMDLSGRCRRYKGRSKKA